MTFPRLRLPSLFLAGLIVCGWGYSSELWAQSPKTCDGTGAQLTAAEVQTILEGAASAFNLQNITIRADRVKIRGVRLPFLKFNRNPFK